VDKSSGGNFVGLLVGEIFRDWNKPPTLDKLNKDDTYAISFGRFDHESKVKMLLESPQVNILYSSGPVWNQHHVHLNYDNEPNLWLVIFELKEDGKIPPV
jgi:hypothetical protein